MADEMHAYYGKDLPSATYRWGVVVPIVPKWEAVAWFKTQQRAIEYATERYTVYAIARLK